MRTTDGSSTNKERGKGREQRKGFTNLSPASDIFINAARGHRNTRAGWWSSSPASNVFFWMAAGVDAQPVMGPPMQAKTPTNKTEGLRSFDECKDWFEGVRQLP
jgi:hypothetical protein